MSALIAKLQKGLSAQADGQLSITRDNLIPGGKMGFGIIGFAGVIYLVFLVWLVFWHHREHFKFEMSHLGLLMLGTALIAVAVLQPKSIKTPYVEISEVVAQADAVNQKAADSVKKADETTKLALETVAILIWNSNRYGSDDAGDKNEQLATNILKDLYGDKAMQYRFALQHSGILLTPKNELSNVPQATVPPDIKSPLFERYLQKLYKK